MQKELFVLVFGGNFTIKYKGLTQVTCDISVYEGHINIHKGGGGINTTDTNYRRLKMNINLTKEDQPSQKLYFG